jgi:hypothetical protein
MEIAVSAAVGVIPIGLAVLFRRLKEQQAPTLQDLALSLPAAAAIGVSCYGRIHEGGLPHDVRLAAIGLVLVVAVVGLVGWIRFMLTFWHDEEELLDRLGTNEGYIPRRRLIPVQGRAILSTFGSVVIVCLLAAFFIHSLLAGAR